MVTKILEKVEEAASVSEELNAAVSRQVENIVEEAEIKTRKARTRTPGWGYRVPCAGVRYYSY